MPYEFDILEAEIARNDEADDDNEPLQLLAGGLTAKSRDGWELVSTQYGLDRSASASGRSRTRRMLISVWRRPTEELYPD